MASTALHPVAQSFHDIMDDLNTSFFERREVIEAIVLTVLAGEHCYILGDPGTGKSELIRALVQRIIDSTYFETSMSRTRPAEAVLGPFDMDGIKQSKWVRHDKGYLTSVDFAFIDEVGKMSPVIGHDMLAAANERIKHEVDNGRSAHTIPLSTMFTASNELIVAESDDAAALWDRLMVRIVAEDIQETSNFIKLLLRADTPPSNGATVKYKDLRDVIDNVIPAITLGKDAQDQIVVLKKSLLENSITASSRRWRKSVKLLAASAFMDGRDVIDADDLGVLQYVLWDDPSQLATVQRACLSVSNPLAEKLEVFKSKIEEVTKGLAERDGQSTEALAAYGIEINPKLRAVKAELASLTEKLNRDGKSTARVESVAKSLKALQIDVYVKCLSMDRDLAAKEEGA